MKLDNVDRFAFVLFVLWLGTGMQYDGLLWCSASILLLNFLPTLICIVAYWKRR